MTPPKNQANLGVPKPTHWMLRWLSEQEGRPMSDLIGDCARKLLAQYPNAPTLDELRRMYEK